MKTNYIFIRKESTPKSQSKRMVMNVLKTISNSVDNSNIEYQYDDIIHQLSYSIGHQKNPDLTYLTINIKNRNITNAKVLSDIRQKINKDSRRKNFYLITSYDDSSQLFCERLYPLFSDYERIIRDVVHHLVTRQFGHNWINDTFTASLKADISRGNINYLIESALYELTLDQLGDYLFTPFCILDTSNNINDLFPDKEINTMSKTELIEKVKSCKTRTSIWERFFSDSDYLNEQKFKNNQKWRNTVMHSKLIYYEDYEKIRKSLESTISSLKKQFGNDNGAAFGQLMTPAFLEALSQATKQLLSSIDFTYLSNILVQSLQPVMQSLTKSLEPIMQNASNAIAQSLNSTRPITVARGIGIKPVPTPKVPRGVTIGSNMRSISAPKHISKKKKD